MRLLLLLAWSWALVHARPAPPSTHTLHQKRDSTVSRWNRRDRIEPSAMLPIRIALTQSDLHKGHDWLMDVSHPDSPNFGKHWSEGDVNRAFAPSEDTVAAVVAWLAASDVSEDRIILSDNKGWLGFDATAQEAEKLFHTEFYEHEHIQTGKLSVACDEYGLSPTRVLGIQKADQETRYYLPHHIVPFVDYIKPGVVPSKLKKKNVSQKKFKRATTHGNALLQMPQSYPKPPAAIHWQSISNSNVQDTVNGLPVDLVNCSTWITPPCVRALYNISLPSGPVNKTNSLGVFEEYDTYSQEDLDLFFSTFFPEIPQGTHPTPAFVDGAVAPVPVADAGGESDLDLTLIYPLIYPQTITLYQTDDPVYAEESLNGTLNGFLDTFLDALDGSFCTYSAYGQTGDNNTIDPIYPDPNPEGYKGPLQCGVYKPTNVISVSYLFAEYDEPVNYQRRQCNEWMKLALQGHTVLFASGDYGVAGFPEGNFTDGQCVGVANNIFSPAGPSTCPYITAVGATQIPTNGSVFTPEEAANTVFGDGSPFTSGGGFSNIFPIPSYQQSAVATYFEVQNPPYPYYETLYGENVGANGGIYNRIGRGFPDISAVGHWWLDFNEGEEGGWGGTSMSAPIVASIINRIVEERLAIGKGPIGFLNPTLYANPDLMHDIVHGNNLGCGTDGFLTAPGWDPVTGLGTPDYPKMLEFFLNLP